MSGSSSAGQGASLPARLAMRCCVCGRSQQELGGNLKTCGGCHKVLYCGRSCQKKDWQRHRAEHGLVTKKQVVPTEVFDVQIALMSGTIFVVKDCQDTFTISKLKKQIEAKERIPHYQQHLVLGTTFLSDGQTLREAGVDRNSCLSLIRDEDKCPSLVDSSDSDTNPFEGLVWA